MRLNNIQSAPGSRPTRMRVGRGIGCGNGKTCGRGHKGQHSRSGGFHKVGFEGGQMPLQRRLPKFGFSSRKSRWNAEVRLHELTKITADVVTIEALKEADIVAKTAKRVKVIASGSIDKPVQLKGLLVTKGARQAIEAAGGKVEE